MSYYISKTIDASFDQAIERVTETLKAEGFGIITSINLTEKLKEKLGVDFRNYVVLGACNPSIAYKALQLEDKIGVMLPCSVVVQEQSAGKIEVAVVDPVKSMQAVENPDLGDRLGEVRTMLMKAVENL